MENPLIHLTNQNVNISLLKIIVKDRGFDALTITKNDVKKYGI